MPSSRPPVRSASPAFAARGAHPTSHRAHLARARLAPRRRRAAERVRQAGVAEPAAGHRLRAGRAARPGRRPRLSHRGARPAALCAHDRDAVALAVGDAQAVAGLGGRARGPLRTLPGPGPARRCDRCSGRSCVVPEAPDADQTPEEQVHALACELLRQVEENEGHLTAARVAIPPGRSPRGGRPRWMSGSRPRASSSSTSCSRLRTRKRRASSTSASTSRASSDVLTDGCSSLSRSLLGTYTVLVAAPGHSPVALAQELWTGHAGAAGRWATSLWSGSGWPPPGSRSGSRTSSEARSPASA